jgi:stage II sporulation protein R
MSHRLYKWEVALIFGFLTALLWGVTTARAQGELADRVIRIHVIANSDSPEDQRLKLAVRDAVLELVAEAGEGIETPEEMLFALTPRLAELEVLGETVLRNQGFTDDVTATLTECWFPTKDYGAFSFPAGEYTALRLVIGNGEGENWWCVAFPPLCVGAAAESIEEAVAVGHFTQEQGRLLTAQTGEYVLKFRSMELLGVIKGLFLGRNA